MIGQKKQNVVIPMGTDTKISFEINNKYEHINTSNTTFLITDSRSQALVTFSEMKRIIQELQELINTGEN
jgi:hypothetical protein